MATDIDDEDKPQTDIGGYVKSEDECGFYCEFWCNVELCHRQKCRTDHPQDCPGSKCSWECGMPSVLGNKQDQEKSGEDGLDLWIIPLVIGAIVFLSCVWFIGHRIRRSLVDKKKLRKDEQASKREVNAHERYMNGDPNYVDNCAIDFNEDLDELGHDTSPGMTRQESLLEAAGGKFGTEGKRRTADEDGANYDADVCEMGTDAGMVRSKTLMEVMAASDASASTLAPTRESKASPRTKNSPRSKNSPRAKDSPRTKDSPREKHKKDKKDKKDHHTKPLANDGNDHNYSGDVDELGCENSTSPGLKRSGTVMEATKSENTANRSLAAHLASPARRGGITVGPQSHSPDGSRSPQGGSPHASPREGKKPRKHEPKRNDNPLGARNKA